MLERVCHAHAHIDILLHQRRHRDTAQEVTGSAGAIGALVLCVRVRKGSARQIWVEAAVFGANTSYIR